ncbi:TonB-dependent receptor [Erythrobacter pelagi]|uniref:TonB-dependent receptor n=1 Tax=Qipengyuania pelagi TaxID=994320 RepID=A0A844YAA5_9SPHN|nr:TonB-dependent receptor [Qipengyuania pelagi]
MPGRLDRAPDLVAAHLYRRPYALWPTLFGVLVLAFAEQASAQSAQDQSAPPIASVGPKDGEVEQAGETDPPLIVVEGHRERDLATVTYTVPGDLRSQASSAREVLSRVPFVEVSDDGRVTLLGRGGVVLRVNGKDVSDPSAILEALRGGAIAKVEVTANPSARESAGNNAGIINIILKDRGAGSYTISAGIDSTGTMRASGNAAFGAARLPITILPSVTRMRDKSVVQNRVFLPELGEVRSERSESRVSGTSASLTMDVNAKFSDSVDLSTLASLGHTVNQKSAVIVAPVEAESRREQGDSQYTFASLNSNLRINVGDISEFTISGLLSVNDTASHLISFGTGNSMLAVENSTKISSVSIDNQTSIGGGKRLDFGLKRETTRVRERQLQDFLADDWFEESALFGGNWVSNAAYTQFQAKIEKFNLQLGMRWEERRFERQDAQSDRSVFDGLFPSLHLTYRPSKLEVMRLSLTRKAFWPSANDLFPAQRYSDFFTSSVGNPNLLLQTEWSAQFEVETQIAKQKVNLLIFQRYRKNPYVLVPSFEDNFVAFRIANSDNYATTGISVSMSGSLNRAFSYDFNSIFSRSGDFIGGFNEAARRSGSSRFSFSGSLLYKRSNLDGIDIENFSMSGKFSAGQDNGLLQISPSFSVGFDWKRKITETLTLGFGVSGLRLIGRPTSTFSSGNIRYTQINDRPPTLSLSLDKAF